MIIFGGLKKLWILFGGLYKNDFLGVITIYFRAFSKGQGTARSHKFQISFGVCLISFRLTVDAGAKPTHEEKLGGAYSTSQNKTKVNIKLQLFS